MKKNISKISFIKPILFQNKETLFDNIYVIEPYDLQFTSNIEFQIPFTEFNNDGTSVDVDVLQFEPQDGVYMKLRSTVDTTNRMVKFQSDTAGVFVFVEKSGSVS